MNRREALQSLAGLASARWVTEGYDPNDIEGWDPMDDAGYHTGRFTPLKLLGSAAGPRSMLNPVESDLPDRFLHIHYDSAGVNVDLEGRGEDYRAGALAKVSPEQARELAVAIYMAAEECERRLTDG